MKDKILKYNKDGSIRPFPKRPFESEMSDREIQNELILSSRNQEKTLNDNLKVQKSILLWIQLFGIVTIIGVVLYIVSLIILFLN